MLTEAIISCIISYLVTQILLKIILCEPIKVKEDHETKKP